MVTRKEAEKEALELMGVDKKEIVLMTKFSPVPFGEEILKNITIKYDKNKILWRYDKEQGLWTPNTEQYLRTIIRNRLLGEEQQKRNYIDEIISYIKDTTYDETFELDNKPNLIGFKNGVYDLKTRMLYPYHPEHYLTNKINIDIVEGSDCPKIDLFFKECIGEEYKQILYDLFAYSLYKRYPYPKVFFIYGSAGTGKSKILELLEKFLGKENFCSVEPQDIQKDIHATAQMQFKMANIVSDINYDALDNINQVKKITGEDTMKIRNMYKEPYNARIYAKQIFSTNKLPIVKEKTRAWYRRVYTIEVNNIVPIEKINPNLIEELTSEEELRGLSWKCVKSLQELYDNNFSFTFDINVDEMQKVYEKLSNPLLLFLEENTVKDRDSFVYQYELKDRLKVWLTNNHYPPLSIAEVNEYMRENYVNSNRKAFNGNGTHRVWSGLGWKSSHNTPKSEEFNHFNHFNHSKKKVYIYRKSFENPVKVVKSVKQEETINF